MTTPYEKHHVEVAYTAGVWTDITADVDTVTEPIQASTGSTPETTGDPASMMLVLHNPGFKYTPGNSLSAYALTSAMPIRIFDLFDEQRIYVFTGFIEFPEIDSVNLSMTQDQTLRVSAVDQLSRWERSPTFVSTLGAHVMGSARNGALRNYWPMLDASPPLTAAVGSTSGQKVILPSSVRPVEQYPDLIFQGGPTLPGDDVSTLQFQYGLNAGAVAWLPEADLSLPTYTTIVAGQVVTAVLWFNQDVAYASDAPLSLGIQANFAGNILLLSKSGSVWHLSYFDGSFWNVDSDSRAPNTATNRWYCVAIRWGWSPNVIELWVDDQVYTGTFGTVVTSASTNGPQVTVYGSAAHAQLYIGAPADFTNADFLTQRQVGLTGLARQTTGDRIKTLARYAGKTDADLTLVDTGGSIMQAAQLAGKTVAEAMYEARDTEQGDLFIDGAGQLNFDDRRTLLNI